MSFAFRCVHILAGVVATARGVRGPRHLHQSDRGLSPGSRGVLRLEYRVALLWLRHARILQGELRLQPPADDQRAESDRLRQRGRADDAPSHGHDRISATEAAPEDQDGIGQSAVWPPVLALDSL